MTTGQKQTKRVQQIYAAIIASFALNFMPNILVQIIASLVFLGVFIGLYVLRKLSEEDGLIDNHTTYLIRSIWIGGGFVILGLLVAIVYFIGTIGMEEYARLGQQAMERGNMQEFAEVYQSRYPDEVFMAVVLTMGPGTVYVAYRFAKGLARAIKGYRMAKPLSWF